MFWWHSPFELPAQITEDLKAAGGQPWVMAVDGERNSCEPLILIYLPPHATLLPPSQWLDAYRDLQSLLPRAEAWHIERLYAFEPLNQFCRDAKTNNVFADENSQLFTLAQPDPLIAVVTLALLREYPALLDAYLDLELSGNLASTSPDSNYVQRLRDASGAEALILALSNNDCQQQSSENKQATGLLEASLDECRQEVSLLRQQVAELQNEAAMNHGLEQRSREQLRKSCEELEDYFLANQRDRNLIEAQGEQLQRASLLLQRMSLLKGIGIGKLPRASIQLLALLEGYRHSLKRAERLISGIRDGGR